MTVLPRSNGIGGGAVTNKQNMTIIKDLAATANHRWHLLADRDNFFVLFDVNQTTLYDLTGFGNVEQLPGLTGSLMDPIFMMKSTFALQNGIGGLYGSTTTNGGTTFDGGIRPVSGSAESAIFVLDRYSSIITTTFQANTQYGYVGAPQFDEFKIPISVYDLTTNRFGTVGFINFFKETIGCNSNDVNAAGSKAVFGNSTAASTRIVVPWSGSAPGSTSTRNGRQF